MQGISVYQENSDEMLEQWVLQHKPLVKKIALSIKRRLPAHIELDDLLQSGLIGLLEAKNNYQNNLGTTFETFASIRIRGAIIDSIRKSSCITRDTLKNIRRVSEVIAQLEQRYQRPATSEEIAAELKISLDEHFKLSQQISVCYSLSLEEIDFDHSLFGKDDENPQDILQLEDTKETLKKVLTELPEREQLVLSLYYVEEFTFKQIAEILDLTEARICQLHSQAISRVRGKMKAENK